MPLSTRALWIDYANMLGLDRASTAASITSAEKIALANEIYEWVYLACSPRVSYYSQAGFSHADGTTVVADSGLTISTQDDYLMTTTLTNISEVFSVHFEGVGATDPGTIESTTELEYLEQGEFGARRAALGSSTAPRYVHWRRVAASSAAAPTAVGKWQILVAPAKSQATGGSTRWFFSMTARKAPSLPDADITSSPPLSADASVPELLPHETYLGGRLMAYEIMLRSGQNAGLAKYIVRNVPKYLLKSFQAARGLGEISVPIGALG